MSTSGRRRTPACLVAAALVLTGSLVLGACSSARFIQGTADESCYLALPTAEDAVGPHTHLDGVRKFTVAGLKGPAPKIYDRLKDELSAKQTVCVAAYSGHFTSDDVHKPFGRPSGKLAVAVVKTPGNELLGTLIFRDLPLRFQHTHPF